MRKLCYILLIVALLVSPILAGTGYVSPRPTTHPITTDYFNSWTDMADVGDVIADSILPFDYWIDSIVVTGDINGTVVILVNGYEIGRYSYSAFNTFGEIFINPIYVPKGAHFTATLENGATGTHSVSIRGHF